MTVKVSNVALFLLNPILNNVYWLRQTSIIFIIVIVTLFKRKIPLINKAKNISVTACGNQTLAIGLVLTENLTVSILHVISYHAKTLPYSM